MRASASTGPPAAKGTTILIGSAANAGPASRIATSAPNTRFIQSSPTVRSCHAAIKAAAGKHSPALGNRRAVEHFGEPRARAVRRVGRQRVGSEEAVIDDLVGVARAAVLAECTQHEQRHVIAARD